MSTLADKTEQAIKRFGKSICIVTVSDHQGRYASPSSAITNLTNDPPSLLLPLEKTASLYPLLKPGSHFGVNVLGAEHQAVVDACIRQKGEQRFSVGDWQQHHTGVPVLADAQASFVCEFEQRNEYGSHGMIVGRVVDVSYADQLSSLIYVDGGFKTLAP
ncbi:flavin reductase family protein [Oceanicoccus sagamiensis]|uniref:Flavin reductase like domain-containing protein n=1 Tax=Oceanicoccus sagamiensis TaxID=716816 RepID=A0A1X9NDC4_9GAMM|nr:flavin reductase family protein [Oceanicoccus sagamiensis]ARN72957.1 hypothetical protein BST96_01845 [Oceanicoccus sagamiensis]